MSPKPQTSQTEKHSPIAGEAAILAQRYAGAFYELADEQKQLDAVAADLRALRVINQESAEFQYLAKHPRLARSVMVKAVQALATTAGFNKLTSNFLALIAQNRRLNVIGAVIEAFLDELAKRRGEFTADVRSAKALSAAQQEQLSAKLRELAGGKVHILVREDASLLGGLTVKLGSRLIDASLKTKLARLERQLKSNMTQKGAA